MALLIGSRALRFWYPKLERNSDYDIIMTKEEYQQIGCPGEKRCHKAYVSGDCDYELEFDDYESNKKLLNYGSDKTVELLGLTCRVAPLEVLLAIKRSHRFFQDHWHKNMRDYHFLKSITTLSDELLELSDLRQSEKTSRSGRFSLDVTNEDFFLGSQGAVRRIYEHDDLHYATCYYNEPLWARCKHDRGKAKIDYDLFQLLTFEDQVRMVQEEAFVIALERKIIPHGEEQSKAFRYAVMRIGTDLCRGWFRSFAVENYAHVMKYRVDFVGKFNDALSNGRIRKVTSQEDRGTASDRF